MTKLGIRFACVYGCGVIAAAQLGKMAALAPVIAHALGIGLVGTALLVSAVELGGALGGYVSGALAQRLGHRPVLLAGLLLLGLAGVGEALAPGPAPLFAARIAEALGYLAVIVSAPVLVAEMGGEERRARLLAFWSSFVPVGVAAGSVLSGALADAAGWRVAVVLWAGLSIAAMLAWAAIGRGDGHAAAEPALKGLPSRRSWALAIGFGCYTAFQVGLFALLPTLLVATTRAGVATAAAVTGAASLANVAGIVLVVWLHGRERAERPLLWASSLLPAAALVVLFAPAGGFTAAAALAIGLNAVSGAYAALVFALLPRVAARDGISAANGLIAQFGATGSLLGPPLYAAAIDAGGWIAGGVIGAALSVVSLVLVAGAIRAARRCDLMEV